MKETVIFDRYPFRFVEKGVLENGNPDYRLQRVNTLTKRYNDEYLFDNQKQCLLAIDDPEYMKWLAGENAYVRDVIKSPY